jgi:glycerophosphoryl diester phosphodiesterase
MKVIAHRGARAEEPENTPRSITRAFVCGADAIEIDVRLSKDRKPVVIHDETLERTTNGFGRVSEKTFKQLRTFDAGKGEKIPSLSEVLVLTEKIGIELVIDLKEENIEEIVVRELVEAGQEGKVILTSFFHASLLAIKKLLPEIKTGIIISCLPIFPVKLAIDAHADFIFARYPRLNREFVEEALKREIEIYPWTINSVEDLEVVRGFGVSGIVTDNPCAIKHSLIVEDQKAF